MEYFAVYGNYFEEALKILEKVPIRCKEIDLSLSHEIVFMMFTEGIVLGRHILGNGIRVETSKVEVISKLSIPTSQRDVRIFLGFTGYYRRFIKKFKLLTRDYEFNWNYDFQKAFETLKKKFSEASILR